MATPKKPKKPYSPKAPRVKYTKAMCKFICEHIEDGLTLAEVCRKYKGDGVPSRRVVLNWQKDHPEFKEQMDFAYYCWVQTKIDRLDYVSKAPLSELYPDITDHKVACEARRSEMDSLKFITGKLAPALSSRWDKAQTIKHEGIPENNTQIAVVSYCLPDSKSPKISSKSVEIEGKAVEISSKSPLSLTGKQEIESKRVKTKPKAKQKDKGK